MILIIDNYDSFTYNLVDYFNQIGCTIIFKKNDVTIEEIEKLHFNGIVISPGPETPQKAGITLKIIEKYHQSHPILGICLGHQAIGEYFGANLEKLKKPKHGKISLINLKKDDIFENMPSSIQVTRYHSLIIRNLSNSLQITSISTDDNEIMSIKHKFLPIWGIQFHPEAHLTQHGIRILENWVRINKLK